MRNRKNLQRISVILVSLLALATFQFIGSGCGNDLGTLTQWSSVSKDIARWGSSKSSIPSTIYTRKMNTNSSFAFNEGMTHARDQWSSAFGISMTISTFTSSPSSSAKIIFYGGTEAELYSLGIFTGIRLEERSGYTEIDQTEEGTWKHNGNNKNGYLTTKAQGCIVDYQRSVTRFKNTCTHELGHALGWRGDSPDSYTSDVMRASPSDTLTLSARDKDHLTQLYK